MPTPEEEKRWQAAEQALMDAENLAEDLAEAFGTDRKLLVWREYRDAAIRALELLERAIEL